MLLSRDSHPFWHPCQQHDRYEKNTRRSPLPKPDQSIKCMLERESEDMELETDLENVFPNVDHPRDAIHHNTLMEITEIDIFDEDESFVFQSIVFYSESKKIFI